MDIAFTVHLPVDTDSVPFIRGLCRQALEHLRIEGTVIDEIALALTEACAISSITVLSTCRCSSAWRHSPRMNGTLPVSTGRWTVKAMSTPRSPLRPAGD